MMKLEINHDIYTDTMINEIAQINILSRISNLLFLRQKNVAGKKRAVISCLELFKSTNW